MAGGDDLRYRARAATKRRPLGDTERPVLDNAAHFFQFRAMQYGAPCRQ